MTFRDRVSEGELFGSTELKSDLARSSPLKDRSPTSLRLTAMSQSERQQLLFEKIHFTVVIRPYLPSRSDDGPPPLTRQVMTDCWVQGSEERKENGNPSIFFVDEKPLYDEVRRHLGYELLYFEGEEQMSAHLLFSSPLFWTPETTEWLLHLKTHVTEHGWLS